jgi:hypothetical protein
VGVSGANKAGGREKVKSGHRVALEFLYRLAVVERVGRMWRRGCSVGDIAANLEREVAGSSGQERRERLSLADVECILADDVEAMLEERPDCGDQSEAAREFIEGFQVRGYMPGPHLGGSSGGRGGARRPYLRPVRTGVRWFETPGPEAVDVRCSCGLLLGATEPGCWAFCSCGRLVAVA